LSSRRARLLRRGRRRCLRLSDPPPSGRARRSRVGSGRQGCLRRPRQLVPRSTHAVLVFAVLVLALLCHDYLPSVSRRDCQSIAASVTVTIDTTRPEIQPATSAAIRIAPSAL